MVFAIHVSKDTPSFPVDGVISAMLLRSAKRSGIVKQRKLSALKLCAVWLWRQKGHGTKMKEMIIFWDRMKVHFRHHVIQKGKEAPFWVAVSFLTTFGIVRYITYSIRRGKRQEALHPQAQQ